MIQGHGGNVAALAAQLGCRPEAIVDMSSNINPLGSLPGLIDHLLDLQIGVFGDDFEQRFCLVVDAGLAVLDRGQDHVVIFAVGAPQCRQQPARR